MADDGSTWRGRCSDLLRWEVQGEKQTGHWLVGEIPVSRAEVPVVWGPSSVRWTSVPPCSRSKGLRLPLPEEHTGARSIWGFPAGLLPSPVPILFSMITIPVPAWLLSLPGSSPRDQTKPTYTAQSGKSQHSPYHASS